MNFLFRNTSTKSMAATKLLQINMCMLMLMLMSVKMTKRMMMASAFAFSVGCSSVHTTTTFANRANYKNNNNNNNKCAISPSSSRRNNIHCHHNCYLLQRNRDKSRHHLILRGGFTEEQEMKEKLLPLDQVKNEIHDRVLYWKQRDDPPIEKHKSQVQKSNEPQRRQKETTYIPTLDTAIDTDTDTDTDTAMINNDEMKHIEALTNSLDWYIHQGIHNILLVPAIRQRKGKLATFLRKCKCITFKPKVNVDLDSKKKYVKLNCRSFLQPNHLQAPTVIVLTGWADSHVKYSHFLHKLYKEGFNVHTYDHRCQGLSESLCPENRQVIDIPSFDNYVEDLIAFYDDIVAPSLPPPSPSSSSSLQSQKVSLVAHSMGCLVALQAQAKKSGNFLNKVVLVCPMLKPITTPLPNRITLFVARMFVLSGQGKRGATGKTKRGPWLPKKGITHCSIHRAHWEILRHRLPEIVAASPSFGFLKEIIKHSKHFRKHIPNDVLKTPMLIMTAGNDTYVNSKVTAQTVKKMKQKAITLTKRKAKTRSDSSRYHIEEKHYPNAFHDVLSEDSYLATPDAIKNIIEFLQTNESTK